MCTHIYTKGLPGTPIHVQTFPRMAGLIAVPLTLSQSNTQMDTHICACVDNLLTALCNSCTCLGLRLLFPSKKAPHVRIGQDWTPAPLFFLFCPHSLPAWVWGLAWSPALFSLTKNNLYCCQISLLLVSTLRLISLLK